MNLLHHKVKDFDTQLKVFEQFTVAATVLDDPQTVCREIDRVVDAALKHKRPVYIELPRDMVSVPVQPEQAQNHIPPVSEPHALQDALEEALPLINSAKNPVILAGVEVHRFGLQELLLTLLEKTGIPVAATILSKSVVRENHPQYIGVYEGAMGREDVRNYVESSDCLILLGTFMTDINLGIFTAQLDRGRSISVTSEKISIHYHTYENVLMEDFITGMLDVKKQKLDLQSIPHPPLPQCSRPSADKPISIHYLFQRLNTFIDDETIVITDTGDAMFAAIDMTIHSQTEYFSPAYYTSLGFAVPASIGAMCARPDLRPLVLVGDGAFQMTGMEISTIVKYGMNPVIVILNNQGYGTERPMLDGTFNDVHAWRYSRLPDIMGTGRGFDINTEDELEHALGEAEQTLDQFCILDVHLERDDFSQALLRLTRVLRERIK
jgi:indolepyruvate decarboxylase